MGTYDGWSQIKPPMCTLDYLQLHLVTTKRRVDIDRSDGGQFQGIPILLNNGCGTNATLDAQSNGFDGVRVSQYIANEADGRHDGVFFRAAMLLFRLMMAAWSTVKPLP